MMFSIVHLRFLLWGYGVDERAMDRQLKEAGADDRRNMAFHKKILNRELPYTIGGGIGQSRLCMYFLRKAHMEKFRRPYGLKK